jgi:hypothetical protein
MSSSSLADAVLLVVDCALVVGSAAAEVAAIATFRQLCQLAQGNVASHCLSDMTVIGPGETTAIDYSTDNFLKSSAFQ